MLNNSVAANWTRVSPIEVLVTRACDPSLHEPNYASHIEVAEYINTKKANNPREAAMLIARLANHRNPHIAVLALALLDTLVQSCGYPFHLQISTKEFLNELVRRFPERPPPFPGPVMSRILDLIHTWKETICADSRWKEDLGNIRDMHRLLSFKGYRFRDFPRAQQPETAAVSNLKSAEELENEDREAQSAKLQELIRRGTPRDLAAAQELMKALAGANPEAKPDYRAQALTELNKLESKVILLNELLDNFDSQRGERFASGDAYDQIASILSSARPKIQKWISDAETDDPESLDTFLQINDQINSVLNRYDAFKRGDYSVASNPIPAESAAGARTANDLSLIDFDDGVGGDVNGGGTVSGGGDDLAGLFGGGPASTSTAAPPISMPSFMAPSQFAGTNTFGSSPTQVPSMSAYGQPQSQTPNPIMLPGTPKPTIGTFAQNMQTQPPNYFGNGHSGTSMSAMSMGMGMGMGGSGYQSPQTRPQTQQPPSSTPTAPAPSAPAAQGKDPFADLAGLF
ncbi:ADP-ribosylation factor-binding [Pleurotus pulmonarius]